MTATALRNMGTTPFRGPKMKRATGQLSNERAVVLVPDTNLNTGNGDDATGTPKLFLYVSSANAAAPYTVKTITFPTVAGMGSNRKFVGAMAVNPTNNNVYIAYSDTANALRLMTLASYNGTTDWTSVTEQVIIAGNAVTDRHRAVDIDVTPQGTPVVIVYEAQASTGQGSWVRIYMRLTDNVTWREGHAFQQFGSSFIRADSEDVSISFDTDGLVANVGKMAFYWALASTTGDNGDFVREITFNFSTGTAGSAVTVGNWFVELNKNQASGTRRGWLYGIGSGKWLWASAIGTAAPFFESAKLTHNVFTGITKNRVSATLDAAQRKLQLFTTANGYAYVTTIYQDGNLLFLFHGQGQVSSRAIRALLMRYETVNDNSCSYMDSSGRLWDGDYNFVGGVPAINVGGGPMGVYGGGNKFLTNSPTLFTDYPVLTLYGAWGNNASTIPTNLRRLARVVKEDSSAVPQIVAPTGVQTNNRPTLRLFYQPAANYSNTRLRAQWTIAQNGDFTTGIVKNILQPYSEGAFVNSTNGTDIPNRMITYTLSPSEALFSGTWYIRGRMFDDLNTVSNWTSDSGPTTSFTVSHPPIALPISPAPDTLREYGTGDVPFTWNFQDTEPTDNQSAYRVIVQIVSDGTVIADTGKVSSSNRSVTLNINVIYQSIPLQWTVQLWDQDDVAGAASNPRLFTLALAPTVVADTPPDTAVVTTAMPNFFWTYTSPGGYVQRTFRVTVYDLGTDPDELIADSGWIFSNSGGFLFPAQILANDKSYRWIVEVRDENGLYATDSNDFTTDWVEPALPPITVTTDKFKNVIDWDDSARDQDWVSWRIYRKFMVPSDTILDVNSTKDTWVLLKEMTDADVVRQYPDPGVMNSTFEVNVTGWTSSTGTFVQSTAQAKLGTGSLRFTPNGVATDAGVDLTYNLIITPNQTVGASGWVRPDTTGRDFRIFIHWVQSNGTYIGNTFKDFPAIAANQWQFFDFVAQAPSNAGKAFIAVTRRSTPVAGDAFHLDEVYVWKGNYVYADYTAPLNKPVSYLVVQVADRFGSLIESNLGAGTTVTQVGDRYFFIPEIPLGTIASFEASSVNGDSFAPEVETETLHVIGRGRQVQVGDDLGKTGSLTVRLRNGATARRDREFFEALASDDTGNVWMKSPFGDVMFVRILAPSTNRVPGVGAADLVDLTIPYLEVFGEALVTRTV